MQAAGDIFHRNLGPNRPLTGLFEEAEAEDANQDQVERDNVVQQPRHDQNKDTGHERDDGLQMSNADGHGLSPFITRLKPNRDASLSRSIADGDTRNAAFRNERTTAHKCKGAFVGTQRRARPELRELMF